VPTGSAEMCEPGGRVDASCVWKGPRTVPSVEEGGLGWSIESTRRLRPRMSLRRMNSCVALLAGLASHRIESVTSSYLPHICTRLPYLRKELYACHPLVEAKACLPRKVV